MARTSLFPDSQGRSADSDGWSAHIGDVEHQGSRYLFEIRKLDESGVTPAIIWYPSPSLIPGLREAEHIKEQEDQIEIAIPEDLFPLVLKRIRVFMPFSMYPHGSPFRIPKDPKIWPPEKIKPVTDGRVRFSFWGPHDGVLFKEMNIFKRTVCAPRGFLYEGKITFPEAVFRDVRYLVDKTNKRFKELKGVQKSWKRWSSNERSVLLEMMGTGESFEDIARRLKRTPSAVQNKYHQLQEKLLAGKR